MREAKMFRQGDVLIERVRALPKGAKPRAKVNGRAVLAEGEATGHAHAVAEPEALLYDAGELLFLQADGTVTVRHEEHAPIELPAGTYKVTRQREYAPEAIRNVQD